VDSLKEQAKALAKSEDAVRGMVIGSQVYDPLLFAPEVVHFSARQYVFLHKYRLGVSLEDAATAANMTPEQAERFLDKPSTRAWLKDRAMKDHIKNEWAEPAKWWAKGDEWLNAPAEAKPNKNDVEIWKQFGMRVCPVASDGHGAKIEININPEAIERSKERRKVVEAQIVSDAHEMSGNSAA
jgi:hypothetical protein